MGRSKAQKWKKKQPDKAFTVRTAKKSKTKVVATNLKKMQLQNKSKTDRADENLKVLQDTLLESAKSSKDKPKKVLHKQKKPVPADLPDVDMASESLSKL